MKNIFYHIVFFTALSSFPIFSQWYSQGSGVWSNIYSIFSIDGQIAWISGANGIILKTTNGGNPSSQSMFEKTYGGLGSERGVVIDKTSDGGFIVGGSTASFTSSEDMYLIKLDSTGQIQWSKVYNSFGYDRIHGVKQTSDGQYYITGYIGDNSGLFDLAFAKISSTGNIVWAKSSGSVQAEELRKLTLTPDGGFFVAGYNASFGVGAKDVQAMKISSDGTIEWAKTYGSLYEDFNSSCITSSDGNYVLGSSVDISGSYDIRPTLIKLDPNGSLIWAKYYSGFIEDWGRDLVETPDGGFLLVGDTESYGYGSSKDIYVIKTSSTGNVEWAKAFGGIGDELVHCIIPTSDSKYVLSGTTNSYGYGGNDAYLMKIDVAGNLEWFHTYGGYTEDNGYDVVESLDLGLALTGRRSSNTLGSYDYYLVKTTENGISNCSFGTYSPNVFNITNLLANNINLGTLDYVTASNLNFNTLTPNSGQTTSCAVIPVELESFNFEFKDRSVILKWVTATEINNQGFKIFRDEDEIGFVTGSGTTMESREYFFEDEYVSPGIHLYELLQIDFDGSTHKAGELSVLVDNIPNSYQLEQNYPNPFNPVTTINFAVPKDGIVKLYITNLLGEVVQVITEGYKQTGYYKSQFDATDFPSGIYFYTLQAENFVSTKKMILLK
jgi:hypothetical protein